MSRRNDPVAAALGRCVGSAVRLAIAKRNRTIMSVSTEAFGHSNALNRHLWGWERRQELPSIITLAKLADALGCDLPDLVPTRANVLSAMKEETP